MGWLITGAVLVLLAMLPLGVLLRYDEAGFLAKLILGPIRLTVYPTKPKKTEEKKPETPAPAPKKQGAAQPKAKSGGSLTDFLPLLQIALDFLGDFRRKLRVDLLELHLTLAGDDPCDLAVNYGRAWAAVGNLMPQLERIFVIRKRSVDVACDFTTDHTTIFAHLELTITLGRLLALLVRYGWRAGKEFLKITNQRKGGANL